MIEFKSERVKNEWNELATKNNRLFQLTISLSFFTNMEFKKPVFITHIFRTPEEHAELYKETPADKRPATSPHMRWEALDLRSSLYTAREKERITQFLNCFSYQGGQRKVCIIHTIAGNVEHTHVQYS